MAVVAKGTKTMPEHAPLRMIGVSRDHCEMLRVSWLIQIAEPAKPRNPSEISQRVSMRLVRKAIMGITQTAPIPRGLTARPAERAE